MQYYIAPPPMNPLTRLLAGLVAVLALVGAFFFGLFVLAPPLISLFEELTSAPSAMDEDCISEIMPSP